MDVGETKEIGISGIHDLPYLQYLYLENTIHDFKE